MKIKKRRETEIYATEKIDIKPDLGIKSRK